MITRMSINKNEKKPGADGVQRSGQQLAADNDIKRLHQLEHAIGEKLEQRDFDEILEPSLPGYALVGPDGFEQMVGLNLDNIELGQAAALIADFRNLHLLSLRDCQLTDISFIQELSQLTHLSLTWIEITDISSLQVLSQLTELNLDITYITDFSPLQGLSQLKHLSLGANQITDISFLQGLNKLTELILAYNQITDISLLQGLSQLTR
ncbi:MAG: internalin, partial [Acidobacteriota bacterium]|nr:internalin [Acidobacteriota bacterium]